MSNVNSSTKSCTELTAISILVSPLVFSILWAEIVSNYPVNGWAALFALVAGIIALPFTVFTLAHKLGKINDGEYNAFLVNHQAVINPKRKSEV